MSYDGIILRGYVADFETADPPGQTFFSYTPDGKKLVTAGFNGAIRVFEHGSDDEPVTIDVSTEDHSAVVAANGICVIGCDSGEVTKYSLRTNTLEDILVRCSTTVRSIALSRDGEWLAVASE